MGNTNFMVSVSCMTFNHAEYIVDAMNGFTIQETTFPFVCTIIDDASTDGEPEVIRNYLQENFDLEDKAVVRNEETDDYVLCFAQHKTNKNCYFAVLWLKYNHYSIKKTKRPYISRWLDNSKYIAMCEGDDYWTYSNKLQEQIAILESHSHYSATTTNASVMRPFSMKPFGSSKNRVIYEMKEIVPRRQFHTATIVYRNTSRMNCPYYGKGGWDTFLWCCLLTQGPIYYEGKITCVYRKLGQGVTETTSKEDWACIVSKWADILIECFVPRYVQRRYVVRSVTRDIISIYFAKGSKLSRDARKKLKELYYHNFSIYNILYDIRQFAIMYFKNR